MPATAAVLAALLLVLIPGSAAAVEPTQDTPDSASEALEQLRQLNEKAERLTEQLHRAQDRLEAAREKLADARAEAAEARKARARALQRMERFRAKVDQFIESSFRGPQLRALTTVLSSGSVREFAEQMTYLDVLAADKQQALQAMSAALAQARQAQQRAEAAAARAAQAKRKAARIAAAREQAREQARRQIAKVQQLLDELTTQQRQVYSSGGATGYVLDTASGGGASQAALQAVQVALNQQGDPYVWAAEGPNAFDCSGLVVYAYGQVGIDLPRSSSQQAQAGRPVSRSELLPGDLIALYSPVHHIGIYVGDGKYVHAPYTGAVVRVEPVPWDLVTAMRRVA